MPAGVKRMSNEILPSASGGAKAYVSAWAASVCDVLGKITGTVFSSIEVARDEAAEQIKTLSEHGVWLRFALDSALKGQHAFLICKADALRLAQILVGEPFDETQDFSAEYRDALAELFRQFAGVAALALKARVGGEVNLQFAGYDPANWKPDLPWGVRLKSEGSAPFLLVILLDPELGESLASVFSSNPARPSRASKPRAPASSKAASKDKGNIDLLLDVELQVSLRFGKREMLLRDILELSAGAVVELDQRILEPVDLLVGGKVVAQGEVVVLEGHYALRVTEILNPTERIDSLRGQGEQSHPAFRQ
jgi:flagellar motor switch protein FliN/FliY